MSTYWFHNVNEEMLKTLFLWDLKLPTERTNHSNIVRWTNMLLFKDAHTVTANVLPMLYHGTTHQLELMLSASKMTTFLVMIEGFS